MDKYLVTGACGFTGSHICELLYEQDIPFRATDLESADRQWLPPDTEFVASDLTDPVSLRRVLEGISIVLHPAAIFDWSASEEMLNAVNVTGMENLCAEAKAAGVKRLVSWSTSGVYGDHTSGHSVRPALEIRSDAVLRRFRDASRGADSRELQCVQTWHGAC